MSDGSRNQRGSHDHAGVRRDGGRGEDELRPRGLLLPPPARLTRPAVAAGAEWARLDYGDAATYGALREALRSQAALYYLATPPSTFAPILSALADAGLTRRGDGSRIVVEKPLGEDEATAHHLNAKL